jgi:hypothetical protein
MGRRRQEEQPMRAFREHLAQPIACGLVCLGTVLVRRHLVHLVHYHQVPVNFLQRLQHLFLLGEIERGNHLRLLLPHIPSPVRVQYPAVNDGKRLAELFFHLALPLVLQVPGTTSNTRRTIPRYFSSLSSSPAIMVLPAPGSSASRKRTSGWRSM